LRISGIPPNEYVLATVHRPKNTDDLAKLSRSTARRPGHYRSSFQLIRDLLINLTNTDCWNMRRPSFDSSIQLISDFVRLLDTAGERYRPGGVQKEAFFLDTPCLTLRNETEWVETVDVDGTS